MRHLRTLTILMALVSLCLSCGVWAQTEASHGSTGAPHKSEANPPASTSKSVAPPGFVVVEEGVLLPLVDEPEHHFHDASEYFAKGDIRNAAAEIRMGAALLKLEAGRHEAQNKGGLGDDKENYAGRPKNWNFAEVESNNVEAVGFRGAISGGMP